MTRSKTTPVASQPVSPSSGLKDAYAGKFLIGCCAEARGYSEAELANIKANYSVVTPENSMKPQPTHPSEDTYNFDPPDALGEVVPGQQYQSPRSHARLALPTGNWFFQPAPTASRSPRTGHGTAQETHPDRRRPL